MNYGDNACKHGLLARSCELCDLEKQVAQLEAEKQETFEAGYQSGAINLVSFKEFSKLAGRALNDAHAVIATIEPEDWDEGKPLCELLDLLRDLTRHAYSLNGVLTAQKLKATEGRG